MTRYTNVGKKRTYLQASFDPNNDQIASNVASTSSLRSDATCTLHESSADPPAESRRKRPRKSKESSEEKIGAEPGPASVDGDGSRKNLQVTKSERKKKALAKLKAKEKAKERAKRAKSACFFFSVLYTYTLVTQWQWCSHPFATHSRCRQSCVIRSSASETHRGTTHTHDVLRMSRGRTLGQGLSDHTTTTNRECARS
jgi:hypothetical protein